MVPVHQEFEVASFVLVCFIFALSFGVLFSARTFFGSKDSRKIICVHFCDSIGISTAAAPPDSKRFLCVVCVAWKQRN